MECLQHTERAELVSGIALASSASSAKFSLLGSLRWIQAADHALQLESKVKTTRPKLLPLLSLLFLPSFASSLVSWAEAWTRCSVEEKEFEVIACVRRRSCKVPAQALALLDGLQACHWDHRELLVELVDRVCSAALLGMFPGVFKNMGKLH